MKVAEVFAVDLSKLNWALGITLAGTMTAPLVVLGALDKEVYWLSVWFGVFFVGLSDPGGRFANRSWRVAAFTGIGAVVTAGAIWVGSQAWGLVTITTFVVVLGSGLALHFGLRRFVAGALLASWFLIAISLPPGFAAAGITLDAWSQAAAWLAGGALWLALSSLVWLARGRPPSQPPLVAELPADTTTVALTPPVVVYAVIRAIAVAGAVAVAFGSDLPYTDWMPIAALVAMKTSLQQSTLAATQRVVGTILGSVVAAVVLLGANDKYVLGAAIVALALGGGALRLVNYALYTTAIAGAALIALDFADPTDFSTEGQRILFTLVGVGIAIVVTLLAGLVQRRAAARTANVAAPI